MFFIKRPYPDAKFEAGMQGRSHSDFFQASDSLYSFRVSIAKR